MPSGKQPPLTFCEWQLLRYLARLGYDPQPKRRCYASGAPEPEGYFVVYRDDSPMRRARHYLTSLRNAYDGALSVHADRAAMLLIERGYIGDPDQHGNRRLTESGRKAAHQPPPARVSPKPPTLRDSDFEVLREMTTRWLTPYEFGARNGSNHSASGTASRPSWIRGNKATRCAGKLRDHRKKYDSRQHLQTAEGKPRLPDHYGR